jgi:hypothetical protein
MNTITAAANTAYDLCDEAEKKCSCFALKGFWNSADAVSNWLSDWEKVLSHSP